MDDSILWDNRQEHLVTKYRLFKSALLEWGLTVNPKKTVFYASPHSHEAPVINLDGVQVESSKDIRGDGSAPVCSAQTGGTNGHWHGQSPEEVLCH